MEYIVAGYNMLTDVHFADGKTIENTPGGSFYSASGVRFWRKSTAYVGTAGPDFKDYYGDWFSANKIACNVKECLPKTLKYTLDYAENGIWSEVCTYGDEYEVMAKDIGRITPAMLAECCGPETKGIYIEASLSAKIADNFKEVKALIPGGVLMWEINGDDLRDLSKKQAIEERISIVDAYSLNYDEACGFFGTEDKEAIYKGIQSYGKPCFFRQGELGAGMIYKDHAVFAPSVGTETSVDPTGCGNCSTAAAMIGIAEGLSPEIICGMANIAAAHCAAQVGPWPLVTDESMAEAEKQLADYIAKTAFVKDRLL